MRMGTRAIAACAIVCAYAGIAAAQDRAMTLDEVLARARDQAPRIVSARLALEETRARMTGASLRLQSNPAVDAWVGGRRSGVGRSTDFELGVSQGFEPGGRRSARIAGANAALVYGAATIDEVTAVVLRDAASAYYRAIHARDRIRLLDAAHDLASSVHEAADRRYRAGDIAVLDVNLARSSLARVRAEREAAEAARSLALGELRQLLGRDDATVDGSLVIPPPADLAVLLQAAAERPELRALDAAIEEAEAERELGRSLGSPEYGLGVRYSHEEGDKVLLGGLTVTLPFFAKGQEQLAAGSARAARLRAELDAARTQIGTAVRAAFDTCNRRLAAVRILETEALVGLDENEQLTTRSFEVGQIGLPELLLIRRETLDTRFQYLDALLEAALARIELDASAGMLR